MNLCTDMHDYFRAIFRGFWADFWSWIIALNIAEFRKFIISQDYFI